MHEGKIAKLRAYYDSATMMRQLGLLPPAGSGVEKAMTALMAAGVKARQASRDVDALAHVARRETQAAGHTASMPAPLIEFPADDPDPARKFWHGVLGVTLTPRPASAGTGWQTDTEDLRLGVHERGPGPGDTASLPYFSVGDLGTTLERVRELGGSIIHPGDRWAVCRDSEGSPFALAARAPGE